jgi:hypothetical protein
MQLILDNPFRILGLPVTASSRQITKRVDDLSMFVEMGKTKSYETDFLFLSPIDRTLESINLAASQLELSEVKLFHSTFWFHQNNSIDEMVFDLLADGNFSKATVLLEKAALNTEITLKNCSNAHNLSLLGMALSYLQGHENQIDSSMFVNSARLFAMAYKQETYDDYVKSVIGSTCLLTQENFLKQFADEALKVIGRVQLNERNLFKNQLIGAFNGSNDSVKDYIQKKIIADPIKIIENAIADCKLKSDINSESSHKAADTLRTIATKEFNGLKKIISAKDVYYSAMSDQVARQLLSCSTTHYNATYENDDTSTSLDESEEISLWARVFAVGANVKTSIQDDLDIIAGLRAQHMVQVPIKQLFDLTTNLPQEGPQLKNLPFKIPIFLKKSAVLLAQIEKQDPQSHLEMSDMIVKVVLGLCITYVNSTEDYAGTVSLLESLHQFRKEGVTRERLKENIDILKNNQINKANNAGGCYIATLVYGDYDDPQVIVLRGFRDNVLAMSFFGRCFISFYYLVSPSLVEVLRHQYLIQKITRKVLNLLVEKLRK